MNLRVRDFELHALRVMHDLEAERFAARTDERDRRAIEPRRLVRIARSRARRLPDDLEIRGRRWLATRDEGEQQAETHALLCHDRADATRAVVEIDRTLRRQSSLGEPRADFRARVHATVRRAHPEMQRIDRARLLA